MGQFSRAVIGDALQEIGDPRGELIALQTSKKPNARTIRKLLDEHAERLAGSIAAIVPHANGRLEFVGGFLDACTIGNFWAPIRDCDEAATAPHWATVTDVKILRAPKRKWFKAWWKTARLGQLRKLAMDGIVLERRSAGEAWHVAQSPDQLRQIELDELERMLATMPRAELARIVAPSWTPVAGLIQKLGKRR